MNVIIYGIAKGVSKKTGKSYCAIHCLDLDTKGEWLDGNITKVFFIDEKLVLPSYKGKRVQLIFNEHGYVTRVVSGN